ncbi:MAG: hypothetical protein IPK82_03510 [Polyangiaceae bacterium]|nr:hypothetical protein [Polyangiaceae bacterium]
MGRSFAIKVEKSIVLAACLAFVGLLGASGCDGGSSTGSGGSGGDVTGGSGGFGGSGGGGAAPPTETQGCTADVKVYASDVDPSVRGPWPVGAKTVTIEGLTTEVWYPAELGSDAGKTKVIYDLRQWLPESEKTKIPDEDTPVQECGCFRDLPMDTAHGPYPVVIFIHGTAGFRTQSLAHMEHWASRGFVVVAADYPGLYLADALDLDFGGKLPEDTQTILTALATPAGELSFLEGHIDMTHVGMSGHSAGGGGIKGFGSTPGVRVLMPLAAGGVDPGTELESTLVMGGVNDQVVDYQQQVSGYEEATPLKRLVGVGNTGHLFPTDLCWMTNAKGQDIVTTAQMYDIKNAQFASALFDCPTDQLSREKARDIVNFATTAALEEKLLCKAGDPFAELTVKYPDVAEYKEAK